MINKESFTALSFQGGKALKFLNDYTLLSGQPPSNLWLPTAFLNRRGTVVATALIQNLSPSSFVVIIPKELKSILKRHLQLFAQFSKIAIDECPIPDGPFLDPNFTISAPMPWIGVHASSMYTVSCLCLDLLGWVDFQKGCYLGQEIVSRMHFKHPIRKKALYRTSFHPQACLLPRSWQQGEYSFIVASNSYFLDKDSISVYQSFRDIPR